MGAGSFIRKSEMTDTELRGEVSVPSRRLRTTFEHGDGDYRPRIPEYPKIQDILGTAVNSVLVGDADPKSALDAAQTEAAKQF